MSQEQVRVVGAPPAEESVADVTPAEETATQQFNFEIPHAERVITVFGVTGAIGNLVKVCPVPEEDKALWTQEKVDRYVDYLISIDETPKEDMEAEEETEENEAQEATEAKKKLV